ncbi:MAG: hypothetical protein M3Q07_20680 [Pseudobdellovibrionaceae bacterium]|nr:hypothetical protein [Pseudobdellovibrionaceae bacterium]
MANGYVHGIVIKKGSGEIRMIRSPSPYVVGLVGTALAAKTTLKNEEPTVFFKKKAALDAIDPDGSGADKGSLHEAVIGVYEQTDATVVLVRAKSTSDADIMSAIEKLTEAESVTGYKPKIIASPGFGNVNPADGTQPVVTDQPVVPVQPVVTDQPVSGGEISPPLSGGTERKRSGGSRPQTANINPDLSGNHIEVING